MLSINLIWEQRLLRRRSQRVAIGLMAVIGAAVLVMAEEAARTLVTRRACQQGISLCEARIAKHGEDARRNHELQSEINSLEPTLLLLQGAQRMTLRWVSLMSELDLSVPDTRQVSLSQLSFTAPSPTSADVGPDLVGDLLVAGSSRSYPMLSRTMRRLGAQRHIGDVELSTAQVEAQGGAVRFNLRAQFRMPPDEVPVMVASGDGAASPGGTASGSPSEGATLASRAPTPAAPAQ